MKFWGYNYSGHFSPHEKIETRKDGVFITHCRKIGSKLMGREVSVFGILGQIVWGLSKKLGVMLIGVTISKDKEKVGQIVQGSIKHLGGVVCG